MQYHGETYMIVLAQSKLELLIAITDNNFTRNMHTQLNGSYTFFLGLTLLRATGTKSIQ